MLRLTLHSPMVSLLFLSPLLRPGMRKVSSQAPALLCRSPEKKTSRDRMVFPYHSKEELEYHFWGNSIALKMSTGPWSVLFTCIAFIYHFVRNIFYLPF